MTQRTVFSRLQSVVEYREAQVLGVQSSHLGEAVLPPANYLKGPYLDQIARTHPERYQKATQLVEKVTGGSRERMG